MQSEHKSIEDDADKEDSLDREEKVTIKERVGGCLKKISLGKYKPALYYNNWDYFSTILSGIVTIICVGILMSYAIIILNSIFSKKVKELT